MKLSWQICKCLPQNGLKSIRHLLGNTLPHKAGIVNGFLQQEKPEFFTTPPYFIKLVPCDYFPFLRLEKMLRGRKYVHRYSV